MKMEKHVKQRIFKNALLSLFIYALPVLLMFAVFYFTGQKPWLKKSKESSVSSNTNKLSTFKNNNND
jgi:hypothetical protein